MRKLVFVIFVSLTFLLSYSGVSTAYENEIRSLSNAMADNIAKAGKKRIAVVDFTDLQGNITELGRFIAEEFSVAIAGAGKGFEVVDRTHLKTIFTEHKLAMSGVIDPATAKKLGQIAGVDALVTGTITPFGDSVRIAVKILDTATAKVIGASSGGIPKTKAIEELLGRGIEGGTIPGSTTTSPPVKPKALAKFEVDDFTFEARSCKWSSEGKVLCFVGVINNQANTRYLSVYGGNDTLLIDNLGNQYPTSEIAFGTRVEKYNSIRQAVPPDIPMNLSLLFKGVASNATSVNLMIYIYPQEGFEVVLRNIPLSR